MSHLSNSSGPFTGGIVRGGKPLKAPAFLTFFVSRAYMGARGDRVNVIEVNATTDHQLVQTYHVLTVPSTVVLDASGYAHAVNYGFASTQRLLKQVDEALAKADNFIPGG